MAERVALEPASPVVVLGAGVHGVAIARELVLQRVPVVLIDAHDIAYGATAKSSRLIHGGLRYLEYGDLGLVRESLVERERLLESAPHFVRPLRLFIPVQAAWSGLWRSAIGFVGLRRTGWGKAIEGPTVPRGYWPTRIGLNMYDWLSGSRLFPGSAAVSMDDPGVPRVNRQHYTGMLAYSDAQMLFPERFVLALLADAEEIADRDGVPLEVLTYHSVRWEQNQLIASPTAGHGSARTWKPLLVINATGAWGDATLRVLQIEHPPLFGGTKGSHFLTWNVELKAALGEHAVYAEAADGRLVFVLPFGDGVLVGTTDETVHGSPADVVATPTELAYLRQAVQNVFGIELTEEDLVAHYCGVRPLPAQNGSNAAISRDHSLVWQAAQNGVSVLTLVGGKLTTWRAFAEEAATTVLDRLQRPRLQTTVTRKVPGHDPLPPGTDVGPALWERWATELQSTPAEIVALWPWYGTRLVNILQATQGQPSHPITGMAITTRIVRWIIQHEHIAQLADLVERRLMLAFARDLSLKTVQELADVLVETGCLAQEQRDAEVDACCQRLLRFYGRKGLVRE